MRVIGGSWRGRRLEAPAGRNTRPTSDRAREAVFNILAHGTHTGSEGSPIPEARVLDAFAGSGALGIEALSRGAAHATFLDNDPAAIRAIETNRANLKALDRAMVRRADCLAPPRAPAACDLVFLDPPYGQGLAGPALTALARAGWIAEGALCVVEQQHDEGLAVPDGFELITERRYGKAKMTVLQKVG
jgi:16S rRNA (guanine966-N2)-methyltransferase